MKQSQRNYKNIVIKIGSSLFCEGGAAVSTAIAGDIARQINVLLKEGKQVTLVSSGAIALGMRSLGFTERPRELHNLQAAAAVGQNELMDTYRNAFRRHGYHVAQILLTWDDFADRQRYLNAKNTLSTLLKRGVVPVINENDTVSTAEIKFGDNDQLSARVASLIDADLLLILSDVEGLLDRNGRVVRLVDKISPQIKALACPTDKKTCVGGMITKIEAAKISVDAGIPCVIAHGRAKGIIVSASVQPESHGTLFVPRAGMAQKDRWMAFGTKPRGVVAVDEGAKSALCKRKSLLSVGVVSLQGSFEPGEVVSIVDEDRCEFARGKAGISSKQLDKVKGIRFDKEVIHCDNIVIIE